MTTKITVTVPTDVSLARVQNLLCGAWEGGSNDWYTELHYVVDLPELAPKDGFSRFHVVPTLPGGVVGYKDGHEDQSYTLCLEKIQKGLTILAEKYPHHWANFINDNDDAGTSDAFLQCCTFGDIIYG